jgi:hypothetical protein
VKSDARPPVIHTVEGCKVHSSLPAGRICIALMFAAYSGKVYNCQDTEIEGIEDEQTRIYQGLAVENA